MNYGMVPPPSNLNDSSSANATHNLSNRFGRRSLNELKKEEEYAALTSGYSSSKATSLSRKRIVTDDDYFENDEEEYDRRNHNDDRKSSSNARSSSSKNYKENSSKSSKKEKISQKEEEEEDPLDAFMADIDAQAKKECGDSKNKEKKVVEEGNFDTGGQTGRDDIDQEDIQEGYIKFLEEYQARHEDDDIYEYDEDGNVIWSWKKVIDPLPEIDHSLISYKNFQKNVYQMHEDIQKLTNKQVFELRSLMDIRVYGNDAPKPVISFGHFMFDEALMKLIRKSQFEKPTPIQAQAIPAALSGRDVLGLAKTGSGKTLAYIWPAIIHIMEQEDLQTGEGPIAVVVVPTRELAIQVYQQAQIYSRAYAINVVCAYGGGSKYEQQLDLKAGAELVICTPGRIMDMIKIEATNFLRTTFLVFDEVDRMFDLGFEPQVKSIADHIRPDRQCLMFSATMKKKVEKLAIHALVNPVKVICGDVGEANADVKQSIFVLSNLQAKWDWINSKIVELSSEGKLLIFVTKKADAEDVAKKLKLRDVDLVLLHGDMLQNERNEQIHKFRAKAPVMVATDVAARGLDIPEIKNVINFDVARDIDTHTHRIGRTGRAGQTGNAYTLVTEADREFCGHLVQNLESVNQYVPPELLTLALKASWFKNQYSKQNDGSNFGGGIGANRQRLGLGYKPKERPGFSQAALSNIPSYFTRNSPEPAGASSASISMTKVIEKAKRIVDNNKEMGREMSRVDMMRSALKSSFVNSFHRSTADEWEQTRPEISDPRPEWKRKLEERVATINQTIGSMEQKQSSTTQKIQEKTETITTASVAQEESISCGKKKRSRWAD